LDRIPPALVPPAAPDELDRIPPFVVPSPDERPTTAVPNDAGAAGGTGTFYLEEAPQVTALRHLLVPLPGSPGPDWINRLFFDARLRLPLAEDLAASYSGRFNVLAQSDEPFPSHQSLRNDFREGYLTWRLDGESFVDAGRINVRNGVAYGFNPTDFFKTRAVVDEISFDPKDLREDRLGTLMVRGQHLFEGGAVTALFAPKVVDASPVNLLHPPSFNPDFNRTNATDRLLLKGNYELLPDVNPELLAFRQGTRWQYGANLTHGIGDATTVYLEWAGGRRASLIEEAIDFGIRTGTFPPAIPRLLPGDRGQSFQNDLSVGGTYTLAKVTADLEYEFHQAGFSRADWRNWFALGTSPARPFFATSELYFIRSYAVDQQEPLSQQMFFTRVQWDDAFVRNLSLVALSDVYFLDGSFLAQASAEYRITDDWTLGGLAAVTAGSRRSQFGSNPQQAIFELSIARYF
jgi:hypothetical protein